MANLETLELTINANAESASKGLSRLISSLSSLSLKVQKTTTSLALLNKELATLKSNSNIKFSGIDKVANNVASNAKKIKKSVEDISQLDVGNRKAENKAAPNYNEAQWKADFKAKQDAYYAKQAADEKYYAQMRLQREIKNNPVVQAIENGRQASSHVQEYINQSMGIGSVPKSAEESASVFMEQMKESVPVAEKLKTSFSKLKSGFKTVKEQIGQMIPRFHLLNRVMRIASTMIIRMGLKALFKGAKEGIENYYQYAKATNNEVAQSMDTMYSSWTQLKNQMGAAIAPAISAAIPVINALASAAITAFNALSQLFALLTGRGTWSKATNSANQFGESIKQATGGGGGGIKEMLAQFDELNVIASESGGGGGAGGAAQDFADMFEEMTQFDKEIERVANMIKDVVGWITDNIAVILETVGLIGIAILGWKLSKAFEGFMSTLGEWIAGGALIAVGIVLDFDFGKKIGRAISGDYQLNWADIVEGILGFVAAGMGGYIIAGPAGAMVGIGISILATITGIWVSLSKKNEELKYILL